MNCEERAIFKNLSRVVCDWTSWGEYGKASEGIA